MNTIERVTHNLNVPVEVVNVHVAPQIFRVRIRPATNKRQTLTKVTSLRRRADDLVIGIQSDVSVTQDETGLYLEIARPDRAILPYRPGAAIGGLPITLGQSVAGHPVRLDLADPSTPHLLIAGTTGSGKTTQLRSIIADLVHHNSPDDLRLVVIDPKFELSRELDGLPHLVGDDGERGKVITGAREARFMLRELLKIARRRYEDDAGPEPRIVVVIDELADLVLRYRSIEEVLIQLAQIGRGVGIHLVIATQRPSVDVVSGLLKSNLPVRVSFRLPTRVDSRVILDGNGAERLLGRGDGLLRRNGYNERFQAPYVSREQIRALVNYITTARLVA